LGIDASPLAIKVATERGLVKAQVLKATQISSRFGRFDTILMMGSNFGLFGNMKRARWLLRKMRNMTSPDARIIAELNRERGKFSCQLKIRVRYECYISDWFEYLRVSRDEMTMILEGTGWQISRFIPETGGIYVGVIEKI
jgi:hypothetical protein